MIKKSLFLLIVSALNLYVVASQSDSTSENSPNKENNMKTTYPSESDVVGELSLPYSGPASIEITEDNFLIVDVGGNIGSFAIKLLKDRDTCKVTGQSNIDYDDTIGLFQVQVIESDGNIIVESFHAIHSTIEQSEEHESNTDRDSMADENRDNCPEGKKCCKCKSNGGGSAEATCNSNEKPVCKCDTCCSSTCVPIRTSIDFE